MCHVCLPFTDISNSCLYDIRLIPNCTSGKDVVILATDTLNRGNGIVGPITWFNQPKPGPHPRALCGTINSYSTLLN